MRETERRRAQEREEKRRKEGYKKKERRKERERERRKGVRGKRDTQRERNLFSNVDQSGWADTLPLFSQLSVWREEGRE